MKWEHLLCVEGLTVNLRWRIAIKAVFHCFVICLVHLGILCHELIYHIPFLYYFYSILVVRISFVKTDKKERLVSSITVEKGRTGKTLNDQTVCKSMEKSVPVLTSLIYFWKPRQTSKTTSCLFTVYINYLHIRH